MLDRLVENRGGESVAEISFTAFLESFAVYELSDTFALVLMFFEKFGLVDTLDIFHHFRLEPCYSGLG
jgi:hypothetical protein